MSCPPIASPAVRRKRPPRFPLARYLSALLLLSPFTFAALDIPPAPLVASRVVEPNINYVLDDSGSMMFEIMPESQIYPDRDGNSLSDAAYLFAPTGKNNIYGADNYAAINEYYLPLQAPWNLYEIKLRSAANNTLYYNPDILYRPWVKADGSHYGLPAGSSQADPRKALWNPARTTAGSLDLLGEQQVWGYWYYQQVGDSPRLACSRDNCQTKRSYWPMTFYQYKGSGGRNLPGSYVRYQIRGDNGYRMDLASGVEETLSSFPWKRSVADEARNFATWFQYYRSRALAAKAASSLAFAELGSAYRVGFATINGLDTEHYLAVPDRGGFSGSARDDFFEKLLGVPFERQGTPLRKALDWAGKNFQQVYSNDTDQLSCRRSFTILTTDGYWNDSFKGIGDNDGDGYNNTLADIARYYWALDLAPGLSNNLTPTRDNSQTQQHMVTFGLSLGVQGSIDPASASLGTVTWPNPTQRDEYKIDDLLHAALNSRGRFVAAANPEAFRQGLNDALNEITQMAGSHSAGTFTDTRYVDDSLYFQSAFDSANWSGELSAFGLSRDGQSVVPVSGVQWRASERLPAHGSRVILFGHGALATDSRRFVWEESSRSVLAQYGLDENLVAYLRGSNARESSSLYRVRSSRLGDIIGSSPVFVGAPSAQVSTTLKRSPMVYVGANDGMLHAFEARSGRELFAYIPSPLLSRLPWLARQDYAANHRYFVDGMLQAGEAQDGQSGAWGSYLAGSLGRGGAGLFLLDVTQPDTITSSDSSARKLVSWEFTAADDADLGLLHQSPPQIVRLNDGKDYVLAPNGYNSSTGSATLFLLPVRSDLVSWKDNYWRLQAQAGPDNGLSAITPHDLNGDGRIDLVYAGDLKGQVWKFDLSATSPSRWRVALGGQPLFQARGPQGLPQPIAAAPVVAPHPTRRETSPQAAKSGLMVFVGTGRYLARCDQSLNQCEQEDSTHSVYGLWDYGGRICHRRELLPQSLQTLTLSGQDYRTTSNYSLIYPDKGVVASDCGSPPAPRRYLYTVKADGQTPDQRYDFPDLALPDAQRAQQSSYWLGWYLDLPARGERVVSYLDYYKKRLEVQTYIPSQSSNVCTVAEDAGYILRLNYQNGGSFTRPRFEDPRIDSALAQSDNSSARDIVGKRTQGSLGRSRIRSGNRFSTLLSLTRGGIGRELDETVGRTVSRVSWREIVLD